MELYILDSLRRRIQIIDQFDSLIWTERYSAFGEFELVIDATPDTIRKFKPDKLIALDRSNRVMRVENVLNAIGKDGRRMLTVKGRSLELLLENRVAWIDEAVTLWLRIGLPAAIARYMFTISCLEPNFDGDDLVNNMLVGSPIPAGTIPEPPDSVQMTFTIDTAYNTIKKICDTYSLGFRIVRLTDSPQLYFDIYSGSDRTTAQSTLDPVIFAPELDNLQDTRELSSVANYKNVAYVAFQSSDPLINSWIEVVYAENTSPDVTDFDRRVLLLNISQTEGTTISEIQAELIQKGKEALAEHRSTLAFDGEIDTASSYTYGVDYGLGDLVEVRNETGTTNVMRVTEQVFVSDREGERSYPTLTLDFMVIGGTWDSWEYNKAWSEAGATEYWADA